MLLPSSANSSVDLMLDKIIINTPDKIKLINTPSHTHTHQAIRETAAQRAEIRRVVELNVKNVLDFELSKYKTAE